MATSIIPQVLNNSDENYVQMPDGTMFCWGSTSMTTTVSASDPFKYTASPKSITFPKQFVAAPVVIASANEHGGYWNAGAYGASTSGCMLGLGGNANNTAKLVFWCAIGRWK